MITNRDELQNENATQNNAKSEKTFAENAQELLIILRYPYIKMAMTQLISNSLERVGVASLFKKLGIAATISQHFLYWTGLQVNDQLFIEEIVNSLKQLVENPLNSEDDEILHTIIEGLQAQVDLFEKIGKQEEKILLAENTYKYLKKLHKKTTMMRKENSNNNDFSAFHAFLAVGIGIFGDICIKHHFQNNNSHAALKYIFTTYTLMDLLDNAMDRSKSQINFDFKNVKYAELNVLLATIQIESGDTKNAAIHLNKSLDLIRRFGKPDIIADIVRAFELAITKYIAMKDYISAIVYIHQIQRFELPHSALNVLAQLYRTASNGHKKEISKLIDNYASISECKFELTNNSIKFIFADNKFKMYVDNYTHMEKNADSVEFYLDIIPKEISTIENIIDSELARYENFQKAKPEFQTNKNANNNLSSATPSFEIETKTENLKKDYRSSTAKIKGKKPKGISKQENFNKTNQKKEDKAEKQQQDSIFGKEYNDVEIYPLHSKNNFIPAGTYFGMFTRRTANESIYKENTKQIYDKFAEILKDGTIVAIGKGIKFGKSKDTFKLAPKGDIAGDARLWSHVEKEIYIEGKRIVLLQFDDEHTHKTQKKLY